MWLLLACTGAPDSEPASPPPPSEIVDLRPEPTPEPEPEPVPPDPCSLSVDVVDTPGAGEFTLAGLDARITDDGRFNPMTAHAPGTGCLILSPARFELAVPNAECETVTLSLSSGCGVACTQVEGLSKGRVVRRWNNGDQTGRLQPSLTGAFDTVAVTSLGGELCRIDFD